VIDTRGLTDPMPPNASTLLSTGVTFCGAEHRSSGHAVIPNGQRPRCASCPPSPHRLTSALPYSDGLSRSPGNDVGSRRSLSTPFSPGETTKHPGRSHMGNRLPHAQRLFHAPVLHRR